MSTYCREIENLRGMVLNVTSIYFPVAKYVVALAYKIHQENQRSPFISINLRGFLLGTPFIDPPKQLDYGNFFYSIGIIGEKERNFFQQLEKVTLDLVRKQRWTDAFKVKLFSLTNNIELMCGCVSIVCRNSIIQYVNVTHPI